MTKPLDRSALRELLESKNPHGILRASDDLRRQRFGREASFPIVDHLDLGSGRDWCPVCGSRDDGLPFKKRGAELHPLATDIHVLVPQGAHEELENASRELAAVPSVESDGLKLRMTMQLGNAADLMACAAAGGMGDEGYLRSWRASGLEVISDGVRPEFHPALDEPSSRRWESFWRAAAAAGIKGHTGVLYGPELGIDRVLDQIERIAALQSETEVFLSVAPLIYATREHGGVKDTLLTQGQQDLRVLALCRLGLSHVPHVRIDYEHSDLKTAHVALSFGADDVQGHLFLEERDARAAADADDLSPHEMQDWLVEAGFEPRLRNAVHENVPFYLPSRMGSSDESGAS